LAALVPEAEVLETLALSSNSSARESRSIFLRARFGADWEGGRNSGRRVRWDREASWLML
jgi:hypothetical protein